MAERKQTKAERKQAGGGQEQGGETERTEGARRARAERKQAGGGQRRPARKQAEGGQPRAERRQARGGRRQRGRTSDGEDASTAELESRLARIEEAVASQSERSEELLGKLDEVLHEARKSAPREERGF